MEKGPPSFCHTSPLIRPHRQFSLDNVSGDVAAWKAERFLTHSALLLPTATVLEWIEQRDRVSPFHLLSLPPLTLI